MKTGINFYNRCFTSVLIFHHIPPDLRGHIIIIFIGTHTCMPIPLTTQTPVRRTGWILCGWGESCREGTPPPLLFNSVKWIPTGNSDDPNKDNLISQNFPVKITEAFIEKQNSEEWVGIFQIASDILRHYIRSVVSEMLCVIIDVMIRGDHCSNIDTFHISVPGNIQNLMIEQ